MAENPYWFTFSVEEDAATETWEIWINCGTEESDTSFWLADFDSPVQAEAAVNLMLAALQEARRG